MFRDARRLKLSALLFGLIFFGLAIGVVLLSNQAAWSFYAAIAFAVIGLISLILIPVLDKQVGTAQDLYDRYELVPAVIAQVNPRDMVILALVNTSVNPAAKPVWALAARTVTRLEGHNRTVGERVPAVAVSGRRSVRDQDHWDEISPMPIAWGTPDPDVVRDAIEAIDTKRWRRLQQHIGKVDDVLATPFNLLEL
ncbi:hypothetical protein CCICO_08555 [Corynebacterium ciconiae DSM 44920]|nr:hypothetical protein CCICO_08555 [Corynebacterium ciconiae DSM 44920]